MPCKNYILALSLSFLLLWASSVRSETAFLPIDAQRRAEDKRLEKFVTIPTQNLYLGEILERLSQQTGIDLTTDNSLITSGTPLLISIRDLPAADVLNALWSFLSYREGLWKWERMGEAGNYRYALQPSRPALELVHFLKEQRQKNFEAHAALMLELARKSPEERKQNLSCIADSLLWNDPGLSSWVEDNISANRKWNGLKVFSDVLSPEQQQAVLRGQQDIKMPVSDLPASGKAFVDYVVSTSQMYKIQPDGTKVPAPYPTTIGFKVDTYFKKASPSMYITLDGGGFSYLGTSLLEKGSIRQLLLRWMLPGDQKETPVFNRMLTSNKPSDNLPSLPQPDPANHKWEDSRFLQKRLEQVAAGAPMSLIAFLPGIESNDPGPPFQKTVRQYLDQIGNNRLMVKCRSGVTLLCDPAWFMDEEAKSPYGKIIDLVRFAHEGQPLLTLPVLTDMMTSLTSEQLERLAERYEIMQTATRFRWMFAQLQQNPKFGMEEGITLTPEIVHAIREHVIMPDNHPFLNEKVRFARIVAVDRTILKAPSRQVNLEYKEAGGNWRFLAGFTQYGRQQK